MAFSYSDKNFTVIGNLCFVHIYLDGTQTTYDIPPAISDRMLSNQIFVSYPYIDNNARGLVFPDIAFATVSFGKIYCTKAATSYLFFYFPIDSNK